MIDLISSRSLLRAFNRSYSSPPTNCSNRKLVFNSQANTFKEKLIEFGKFILGRLFTMIIESVGFYLMFNILHITYLDGLISKCTITVIVIILNLV